MSSYLNKDKQAINFLCPACGNNKFDRVPRSLFEKSIYYLSLGSRNAKKFECTNCKWTVLLKANNK